MISRDRQAIVIGASSGIGRELARLLGNRGYTLGLAARRVDLLEQLAEEIPGGAVVKRIDVADTAAARFTADLKRWAMPERVMGLPRPFGPRESASQSTCGSVGTR